MISEYTAFKQYIELNGGCHFTGISIAYVVLLAISTAMGFIWLNFWSCAVDEHDNYFVYIFLLITIVCTTLLIMMAQILHQSKIFTTVHSDMIRSLLYAPLSYF